MRSLLKRARVVQNAYVVGDLEASCRRLYRLFGIGPFVGNRVARFTDHRYRGRDVEPIELKAIFVQSGEIVIELIQVLSAGPSAFHDMYAPGEGGLHHVAIFTDRYESERDAFVGAGYPVASEFLGAPPDCRVSLVDTRPDLGHMVELYPDHPAIREFYAATRAAADAWDGRFAIQSLGKPGDVA
jgi:hypothetical protein